MIFETARLIARPFGPRDLGPFVAMRADPEVARYQDWEDFTEDDGRSFIADLSGKQPGDPGWFQFALENKVSGCFTGDCGLFIDPAEPRLARIGYNIAREFWRRAFFDVLAKYSIADVSSNPDALLRHLGLSAP